MRNNDELYGFYWCIHIWVWVVLDFFLSLDWYSMFGGCGFGFI